MTTIEEYQSLAKQQREIIALLMDHVQKLTHPPTVTPTINQLQEPRQWNPDRIIGPGTLMSDLERFSNQKADAK